MTDLFLISGRKMLDNKFLIYCLQHGGLSEVADEIKHCLFDY